MNLLPIFNAAFVVHGFMHWQNPDRKGNGFSFKGSVSSLQFGNIEVEFYFCDQSLTALPKAYILTRDQKELQPYYFPHLDGSWQLCYEDGSKIFDKFRPEDMVRYSIESVLTLLNSISPYDMNEIIPEFRSYWDCDYYYGILAKNQNRISLFERKGNNLVHCKTLTFA